WSAAAARAPVVAIFAMRSEPRHHMIRASVRGLAPGLVVACAIQLRGREQRAVIIDDFLRAIAQQLAIVLVEKTECVLGGFEIALARQLTVFRQRARR